MIRRRKTIRRRSERVLALLPERARIVDAAWARDGGRCRARTLVPHVACGGPLEVHEVVPRSAWREGELVLSNVIVICRAHHTWVGNEVHEAHRVGLHGFSWERNP